MGWAEWERGDVVYLHVMFFLGWVALRYPLRYDLRMESVQMSSVACSRHKVELSHGITPYVKSVERCEFDHELWGLMTTSCRANGFLRGYSFPTHS